MVIPALDEAETVEAAIASARTADEIVLVDGGSLDRTADRARAAGARVIETQRGRARQLEAGWRATGAEVVLFLHADTRLPLGWADAVRAALADPSVAGGAFQLRFDERTLGLRIVEWAIESRIVQPSPTSVASSSTQPRPSESSSARNCSMVAKGRVRRPPASVSQHSASRTDASASTT